MFFFLLISLLLLAGWLFLWRMEANHRNDVDALFALSEEKPIKRFSYAQLEGLPEPVQRYFKYALKEGQPYVRYVRLKHKGQFKTQPDKSWVPIEGEQYFTASPPGFIWKGRTTFFTAHDRFVNGEGNLTVRLLHLFKMVDTEGLEADEAELQRWVSENFWFPTNLLPGPFVEWEAIDRNTAKLNYAYKHLSFSMLTRFNEKGQIIRVEVERYKEPGQKKTWIGRAGAYEAFDEMMIPTFIEAVWKEDTEEYPYARFELTHIEYGIPESY